MKLLTPTRTYERLNPTTARECLDAFEFDKLFIEELGWSNPKSSAAVSFVCQGATFTRQQIANLAGVAVFEVTASDGKIPDAETCKAVHKEVATLFYENLLIFLDGERTQSLWYWVKREGSKHLPRRHSYFRGQPGDLFLSKISAMFVDIADLDDEGDIRVTEVAKRLQTALDVETTTKKFYRDFEKEHVNFLGLIAGIGDERDRRWYASVLLNRLMFIYFLQRKGFLDGNNQTYLQDKLALYDDGDEGLYYGEFLKTLFFEGFAKPADKRTPEANALLGSVLYLNGGLFLEHQIEERWPDITIPDKAFQNLFALFSRYSWNLNDTPGGKDDEINPDVLGYIFEKYINQKAFGAYYTRTEITEYLCEQTIHKLILDKVSIPAIPGIASARQYDSIAELLMRLDAGRCRQLLTEILPGLSLLDPACGSGAFLVAAMKTLLNIYGAVVGKAEILNDNTLNAWLAEARTGGRDLGYYIKKRIITDNLFGVDIMQESTEIAKLRLFLALVSSAQTVEQLEPLPNIDFNILAGNSLIGLLRVQDEDFKRHDKISSLFQQQTYQDILKRKNRMIALYRDNPAYQEDLRAQRNAIDEEKRKAYETLNDILLDDFKGIKYEQATWDEDKNADGKPVKRPITLSDVQTLNPFHWGYEFDEVLNNRGGFDAIITNPPWEVFETHEKEFFQSYMPAIQKNKIRIEDWRKQQSAYMQESDMREAWLNYASHFPHVSAYFKGSKHYKNQISYVNGRNVGSKINLYTYFTEQCYNLLRTGGECGIVVPGGIYSDLGTKQLRMFLFNHTKITGLFCLENRKEIFEGVDSRFKIAVLTFEKGGQTSIFPVAFMRLDVAELERFPREGALNLSTDLIDRLSPDSLSIMEFKNETDVQIAQKMMVFPFLGEKIEGKWSFTLTSEFNMTTDSYLFRTSFAAGRMPLFEGKVIHQFNHKWSETRYWIEESEARKALLGRSQDTGQRLDYSGYRLGHRSIARSNDERTMIATILPPNSFYGHSINATRSNLSSSILLYLVAILDSFVVDFSLRQSVSANITMFYIYQLPVPRLTERDPQFAPIVERAARLICTTPEFDDLAKEVGLRPLVHGRTPGTTSLGRGAPVYGITDTTERAKLRAELDGLIAHLYGLTEDEFAHILRTFPLVSTSVKVAAQNAYRDVERGLIL